MYSFIYFFGSNCGALNADASMAAGCRFWSSWENVWDKASAPGVVEWSSPDEQRVCAK